MFPKYFLLTLPPFLLVTGRCPPCHVKTRIPLQRRLAERHRLRKDGFFPVDFAYVWHKLMVNVGKHSIHGSYRIDYSALIFCCQLLAFLLVADERKDKTKTV